MFTASLLAFLLLTGPLALYAEGPESAALENEAFSDEALRALSAIRKSDEAISRSKYVPPLAERLLTAAKRAYLEKRFSDAHGIAVQSLESLDRTRKLTTNKTESSAPTIDAIFEAMTRLGAAEATGSADPRIPTARELISTAEAALFAGKITQADQFARRAAQMIASIDLDEEQSDSGIVLTNVNFATQEELARVPGMTPLMIENLIWFRERIGRLRSIAELKYVPGFADDFLLLSGVFLTADAR